jgi:hypothetical protein
VTILISTDDITPFYGFTENALFKLPLTIPKESETLLFRGKFPKVGNPFLALYPKISPWGSWLMINCLYSVGGFTAW